MRKTIRILLLFLFIVFLGTGRAGAALTQLDFNIAPPTAGWIEYTGTYLEGSGIQVDTVIGLNTPLNDHVTLPIVGGVLWFKTGGLVSTNNSSFWEFGQASPSPFSITLDGTVSGQQITLRGTMLGAIVTRTSMNYFTVSIGDFVDTKNRDFLALFGLADEQFLGNFNISFNSNLWTDGHFSSRTLMSGKANDLGLLSGGVTNTLVPVPPTLLLLGTGLVGFFFLRRKSILTLN